MTTFDSKATTDEVLASVNLKGKSYLVTGGTCGIGRETVRALAAAGADVRFTATNGARGSVVADELRSETGNMNIHAEQLDLTSVEQVERFVASSRTQYDKLDGLILNAGAMIPELRRNAQGIEHQFMIHYAGHLMLAVGMAYALTAGAPSRIVSVTSSGHKICPPDYADINFRSREHSGFLAYGQSKSAAILLAVELDRRLAHHGVRAFAVHPGVILDTELSRHTGGKEEESARIKEYGIPKEVLKTVKQGAATSVWAAVSPDVLDKGAGGYLEDCGIAEVTEDTGTFSGGVMAYAIDTQAAEELWDLTEKMLGVNLSSLSTGLAQ